MLPEGEGQSAAAWMRATKVTVSPTETVAPTLLPFTVRSTVGVTKFAATVWVNGADWLGAKLLLP